MITKRTIILFLLIFAIEDTHAQLSDRTVNSYFLNQRLFPISMPDVLIEPDLIDKIGTIDMIMGSDSAKQLQFKKKKVRVLLSNGEAILKLQYKYWGLSKIVYLYKDSIVDQITFIRIFPYELGFCKGLHSIALKTFGNILRLNIPRLRKTKIKYKNGRIQKAYCYDHDYPLTEGIVKYLGYCIYKYPNDTTVIESAYDKNDNLSVINTHTFNSNGNILSIKSLIMKGATIRGLNDIFPPNEKNEYSQTRFSYEFDNKGNWIRQDEYRADTIFVRRTRIIKYRE